MNLVTDNAISASNEDTILVKSALCVDARVKIMVLKFITL